MEESDKFNDKLTFICNASKARNTSASRDLPLNAEHCSNVCKNYVQRAMMLHRAQSDGRRNKGAGDFRNCIYLKVWLRRRTTT